MKENNYKPQIPDVMEAIFDAAYLIFDLIAAMLFFIFSEGKPLFYPVWNINTDALRRGCFSSGTQNYPGNTRNQ